MTSTTSPKRSVRYVRRRPGDAPSGSQVERERSMWGPNPDPAVGRIEGDFYRGGLEFLTGLYAAAFGQAPPRKLRKALGPHLTIQETIPPADWGALAESYQKAGNPLELRDEWSRLIDRLVTRIFPGRTQQELADRMAIHTHWLGRARARSEELAAAPPPEQFVHAAQAFTSRVQRESLEWTRTRALEGARGLEEDARRGLLNAMISSRQAGEGSQALARRCFDGFADLNRDWRRTSLTETAAAMFNGTLAAADDGMEAVWISAVGACPWCAQWNGKVFRVVKPDDPRRNPQTDLWAGKTNLGRSGARKTRDGRVRGASEIYQPCQPCHPNCSCSLVMRRKS